MKTAIGSLTLALTLIVTPGAAQSTSAAAEGPRVVPRQNSIVPSVPPAR